MSMESVERPPASLEGYVPFPDRRQNRYREEGFWNDLCFHEVLDRAAEPNPDKPAVIGPNETLSYGELVQSSRAMASYLIGELGLNPCERVIFQLPNVPEFVISLFACSRAGIIPVMVLPRHREAEVRHQVDLTDARAYIANAGRYPVRFDYVDLARTVREDYESFDHVIGLADPDDPPPDDVISFEETIDSVHIDRHFPRVDEIEVDPARPGLMLLSGGTTGLPKAIPRTHNDYVFQWEHCARVTGVTADWTAFPSVPIGHNASLCCIVGSCFWAGGTVAVDPNIKPEGLMDLIDRTGGNYSLPMPTQIIDILNHPRLDEYDLSSLEVLWSGGQKVPPKIVREAVNRWDIGFCNVFGMAEGPLIETRPEDDLDVQAETVGRPLVPEADECRLVDLDRDQEVPTGETGELSVRGPGFFTGYFRNEEENEQNFDGEGWFYTEDVLARREDGNYEVYGRIKDTIIRGGENIYAPALEDLLIEHERIENAAVIGMPDERLGERVCAYVELTSDADSLTLDDVTSYLDDQGIAVFKLPERLELLDSLPRTEVGKVDKKSLKERITDRLVEEGTLEPDG